MNCSNHIGSCLLYLFESSFRRCGVLQRMRRCEATVTLSSTLTPWHRFYHTQHRIPKLPQLPTNDHQKRLQEGSSKDPYPSRDIHVGYLLHRHPVVKPTLHPLERSMGFLLEQQHQLYSRHPSSETACHFFRDRQQESIDAYQRKDPQDIRRDFFGLEGYQDALKATLQRYQCLPPRLQAADFVDITSRSSMKGRQPGHSSTTPPSRHTLQRKLDDYLYLIVRYARPSDAEGAEEKNAPWEQMGLYGNWGIPFTPLQQGETLRMAAERCIQAPHTDSVDFYLWGSGPQGTITLPASTDLEKKTDTFPSPSPQYIFLYSATYLAGKPDFSRMQPMISDHAWVSRRELLQYRREFVSEEFLELLLDISADAYFETE